MFLDSLILEKETVISREENLKITFEETPISAVCDLILSLLQLEKLFDRSSSNVHRKMAKDQIFWLKSFEMIIKRMKKWINFMELSAEMK